MRARRWAFLMGVDPAFCRITVYTCLVLIQPVPVEAPAGPDVFPAVVLDEQRLLSAIQPLRRVGPRLRRLLGV